MSEGLQMHPGARLSLFSRSMTSIRHRRPWEGAVTGSFFSPSLSLALFTVASLIINLSKVKVNLLPVSQDELLRIASRVQLTNQISKSA